MCRVIGGARQVDGQAEYPADQMLAAVFGVECGVTIRARDPFFYIMTT